ncbi:MAG: hypothetical protein ACI814_005304, partial [Mariniblastus sp.]
EHCFLSGVARGVKKLKLAFLPRKHEFGYLRGAENSVEIDPAFQPA